MCETYARIIIAPAYACYKEKVLGERPGQIDEFSAEETQFSQNEAKPRWGELSLRG